ncbi:MAG: type II toxin-antitoxin system death-on-curing family toxin [Microbacteriaceae bacterium]|nr:type II toxin-antitoxin system death-on-curing family toxin [Cryobacterium sp.]MCC6375554.1 type II toxin-antitoxin system death-on-curing family toxin [Microbacteriaceae bacterium]
MTIYLDPEQGLAIVERLGFRIRDRGLFLSALARPATSAFGEDAYETIELKAAALLSSLVGNHALFDGNKRTAWVTTMAFLNLNGLDIELPLERKFNLVVEAASGTLELEQIAEVISEGLVELN